MKLSRLEVLSNLERATQTHTLNIRNKEHSGDKLEAKDGTIHNGKLEADQVRSS